MSSALKLKHRDEVTCVAASSSIVATGSEDGTVRLWRGIADCEAGSERCVKCVAMRVPVASIAISASGMHLAIAVEGGRADVLPLEELLSSGDIIVQRSVSDHFLLRTPSGEEINEMAFLNDDALALTDDQGDVSIASWTASHELTTLPRNHETICACAFFVPQSSKDAARLITGGMDSRLVMWDLTWSEETGDVVVVDVTVANVGPHEDASSGGGSRVLNPPLVHSAACRSDGSTFYAGLGDGTVGEYACADLECVDRFSAHRAAVASVSVCGDVLFTASADMRLRRWLVQNEATASSSEAALQHKPNWISCVSAHRVVVADVSSKASVVAFI